MGSVEVAARKADDVYVGRAVIAVMADEDSDDECAGIVVVVAVASRADDT